MKDVIRTLQFSHWEELKEAAFLYSEKGYEVRVCGWDDIRNNRLSILDDWAEGDEEMSKCKSCGKEIRWVKTFSGKTMPVDAEKVFFYAGDGKDIFVTTNGAVIHGTRVDKYDGAARVGFISHFATCPDADSYRKGQK